MPTSTSDIYKQLTDQTASYGALLVAVSKRQSVDKIQAIYELGQRHFGENRVQEFLEKHEQLPADIKWHMIGHLQTNKVKSIIGKVHLVHSVDRLKLAKIINEESAKLDIKTPVLLQIKIAQENTKTGYGLDSLQMDLEHGEFDHFNHIQIQGVMGMATFSDDKELVRSEFKTLRQGFEKLKKIYFKDHPEFTMISMGMSGDYLMALEEGSTMVRVGSKLFGMRT